MTILKDKIRKALSQRSAATSLDFIDTHGKRLEKNELKRNLKKVNDTLFDMNHNKYWDGIPVKEIKEILEKYKFDTNNLDGIYTGAEGSIHEPVGFNKYIKMTWYKMESGKYEIVAYVN